MSENTQKNPTTETTSDSILDTFGEFKEESKAKTNEIEYSLEDIKEDSNKKGFFAYLFLFFVLIALIFGGGYYFLTLPSGQSLLHKVQEELGFQTKPAQNLKIPKHAMSEFAKDEEIKRLQDALSQKERELANLAQGAHSVESNTITRLRYMIKPKEQIIAECFSMKVGQWEIPQSCMLSIATNIDKELQEDKRVVAFEVQGIVDTNPYRGFSPELKQEGLASFRAWNAIRAINDKIPNATVFEGPSLQLENKRGYSIKAYFVE